MNNYLKKEIMDYCKSVIKRNVRSTFYNKKELLEQIDTYGLDEWQDMVEDGEWKLIDEIENAINEQIEQWARFYQYEIDEDLLLDLDTEEVSDRYTHCYYNKVPRNFPQPRNIGKYNYIDHTLSNILGGLRIPLKEFINYSDIAIEELPIYGKLNEENRKKRKISVKNYIEDLREYFENKRWEEDED